MSIDTLPFKLPCRVAVEAGGLNTPPPERLNDFIVSQQVLASQHDASPTTPIVACLGVGYVGLHLVTAFAREYMVIAYDPNKQRLEEIAMHLAGRSVFPTSDAADIALAMHFIVAVPTSLHRNNCVDTKHLRSAIELIQQHARTGSTVIVESSVAVGMTRELLKPLMLSRGFKGGMSPERVDPGRSDPRFEQIPKIISGLDDITPGSRASIHTLYRPIFSSLIEVSTVEVAEMTKLYENCQRMVCLSFANEMADACESLDINPIEVSAAAATKPFGYQPYTPGLGVGGHCIPVNPYYLMRNARFPLLDTATKHMARRPADVGDRIMNKFIRRLGGPSLSTPRILVVGAGFKRGQAILSNSPGVALMTYLVSQYEAHVEFMDPLVEQDALPSIPKMQQVDWNASTLQEKFDIIVVAVNQSGLDMSILRRTSGVLIENFTGCLPWGSVKPEIRR